MRYHDDHGRDAAVTMPTGQLDAGVRGAGAAHQREGPGGVAGRRGHQLPVQPDGDAPGPRVRMGQSGHTDTTQDHAQVRLLHVLKGYFAVIFLFG